LLRWKYEEVFSRRFSVSHKVWLYDYFVKVMATDVVARHRLLPECGVFSDGGTTHNFTEELLRWHGQNYYQNNQALNRFLGERSIILLDAPEEYILENLHRRHLERRSRQKNDWLAHMSSHDVMNMIRRARNSKLRWVDELKNLGRPTLTLNASEDFSLNQRKLANFLQSILKEKK
jgi:hypothetical protein